MRLRIQNFDPIRAADVTVRDLNISVGPQASGKSLFWQLPERLPDAPTVCSGATRGLPWMHTHE